MQALTPEQKRKLKRAVIQDMIRNDPRVIRRDIDSMRDSFHRFGSLAGDPADRKGVDRYTESERSELVRSMIDEIMRHIPTKDDIVSAVMDNIEIPPPQVIVKEGKEGKPGKAPTKKEIREIVRGMIPTINEDLIAAKVRSRLDIPKQITIEEVLDALRERKLIRTRDVYGLEQAIRSLHSQIGNNGYLHGGGDTLAAGPGIVLTRNANGTTTIGFSGSSAVLAATGAISDSNTAFAFSQLPSEIVVNGSSYTQTGGAITWSWVPATLTATLSVPVGTGGSIYGRV